MLHSAGLDFDRVVFARVYLVNFQDFDKMNAIYETYFRADALPSRTCIGVTGLAVGALVEIDFVVAAWRQAPIRARGEPPQPRGDGFQSRPEKKVPVGVASLNMDASSTSPTRRACDISYVF